MKARKRPLVTSKSASSADFAQMELNVHWIDRIASGEAIIYLAVRGYKRANIVGRVDLNGISEM